jgi:hypothetical protein
MNIPLRPTRRAVDQLDLFARIIRAATSNADADVVLIQQDLPSANSGGSERFDKVLRAAADSDRVPAVVVGSLAQAVPLDDDRLSADGSERIVLATH